MDPREHFNNIQLVAERDGRFTPEALIFVSEAVGETVKWVRDGIIKPNDMGANRDEDGGQFHVSGMELLEGFRLLSRKRWGAMARYVLASWGIRSTEDVGKVVFLMVDSPELDWRKRECDTIEDFKNGYDFKTAFDNAE